jgi:hypothetical protein
LHAKKFCTNIYLSQKYRTWSEMKGVRSKIIGDYLFSIVQNKQSTDIVSWWILVVVSCYIQFLWISFHCPIFKIHSVVANFEVQLHIPSLMFCSYLSLIYIKTSARDWSESDKDVCVGITFLISRQSRQLAVTKFSMDHGFHFEID